MEERFLGGFEVYLGVGRDVHGYPEYDDLANFLDSHEPGLATEVADIIRAHSQADRLAASTPRPQTHRIRIPVELIRYLVSPRFPVPTASLRLEGYDVGTLAQLAGAEDPMTVEETMLDLSGSKFEGGISLRNCDLSRFVLDLGGAALGKLDLSGSEFLKVEAQDIRCDGPVLMERVGLDSPAGEARSPANGLQRSFFSLKGVRLSNSSFGSFVSFRGAWLGHSREIVPDAPKSYGSMSLNVDEIECSGGLFLNDRFVATGQVFLNDSRIGGSVDAQGGFFYAPRDDDTAINVERTQIEGSLFLGGQKPASADDAIEQGEIAVAGTINLDNSRIGGILDCSNAWLTLSGRARADSHLSAKRYRETGKPFLRSIPGRRYVALSAQGTKVEGETKLDGAQVEGAITFKGAELDGPFRFRAGKCSSVNLSDDNSSTITPALIATDLTAKRSIELEGVKFDGLVDFRRAVLDRDVSIRNCRIRSGRKLYAPAALRGNPFERYLLIPDIALDFDLAQVGGSVEITGSRFMGMLKFDDCSIEHDLTFQDDARDELVINALPDVDTDADRLAVLRQPEDTGGPRKRILERGLSTGSDIVLDAMRDRVAKHHAIETQSALEQLLIAIHGNLTKIGGNLLFHELESIGIESRSTQEYRRAPNARIRAYGSLYFRQASIGANAHFQGRFTSMPSAVATLCLREVSVGGSCFLSPSENPQIRPRRREPLPADVPETEGPDTGDEKLIARPTLIQKAIRLEPGEDELAPSERRRCWAKRALAIDLRSAKIKGQALGDFHYSAERRSCRIEGGIDMTNTDVGMHADFRGVTIQPCIGAETLPGGAGLLPILNAKHLKVERSLVWRPRIEDRAGNAMGDDGKIDSGEGIADENLPVGWIDLSDARVGLLDDEIRAWPAYTSELTTSESDSISHGNVRIQHFQFTGLRSRHLEFRSAKVREPAGAGRRTQVNVGERLAIIRRQYPGDHPLSPDYERSKGRTKLGGTFRLLLPLRQLVLHHPWWFWSLLLASILVLEHFLWRDQEWFSRLTGPSIVLTAALLWLAVSWRRRLRISEHRKVFEDIRAPDCYDTLAQTLDRMGLEGGARDVRTIKVKERYLYGEMGFLQRFGTFILSFFGYGFKPWRGAAYLLLFSLLGAAYFVLDLRMWPSKATFFVSDSPATVSSASPEGPRSLEPSIRSIAEDLSTAGLFDRAEMKSAAEFRKKLVDPPGYPKFAAYTYCLDVMIPFVDLHQEEYWVPASKLGKIAFWTLNSLGWLVSTFTVVTISRRVR